MVFILGRVLPFDINSLGVTPRTLVGLVGIPATPFLHANLHHLLSNTVPLFVLLARLAVGAMPHYFFSARSYTRT
ncbi:MAG: hypothetical protein NTY19_38005 [Planctomycetota bacterium]|nr:hypothetical protein [Planctomycetota bacterium]